jgi:hypothetical protein
MGGELLMVFLFLPQVRVIDCMSACMVPASIVKFITLTRPLGTSHPFIQSACMSFEATIMAGRTSSF